MTPDIALDVPPGLLARASARWLLVGFLFGLWLALVLTTAHASGYRAGRAALLYSLDAERARRVPRKEQAAPVEEPIID